MADLGDLFRRLEALEGAMSLLYASFASTFAADRDVASFFAQLADEERGHGDLARFQRNLVTKNRAMFGNVDADVAAVEGVQAEIRAFRETHPRPSLREALVFAMIQEKSHAEQLTRSVMAQADGSLASFVKNLAGRDQAHYARLAEIARRRNVPLPPDLQDA